MRKNNIIEYKGYTGSVHFDSEEETFYGKIEFIRDLITFEATSVKSLKTSFRNSVDDYLETCRELGKSPEKPFKGAFNVRISPEMHKNIGLYAACQGSSINSIVKTALEEFIKHHKIVINN